MNKDIGIDRVQPDGGPLTGPAFTFTHPDEVLHSSLSVAEKRGILAAWASDARAIPNRPAMRRLDSGAIVDVGTVLAALRALDASTLEAQPNRHKRSIPGGMLRTLDTRWLRPLSRRHRDDDDDDDPPPCPATALPPGVELELRRLRDVAWMPVAA